MIIKKVLFGKQDCMGLSDESITADLPSTARPTEMGGERGRKGERGD